MRPGGIRLEPDANAAAPAVAAAAELDGVVDQLAERLAQPRSVGQDPQRHVGRDEHVEVDVPRSPATAP